MITAEAPRGGVCETIADATYVFLLRNREIERFEDKHRGIFELWEAFFGQGTKANSKEVKDLLALALVGGGKTDSQADEIIKKSTPADLMRLYQIAQATLGIAFIGLKPEEIRNQIPKDTWLAFEGWNDAHSPKKAGSDAMSKEEYRELVRTVENGNYG